MLRELLDRIAVRGATQHRPIPPLDGTLTPNDRLRDATPICPAVTSEPRDIVVGDARGVVYVTDADRVLVATEDDLSDLRPFASLPAAATGAALAPDGRLLVGVEDVGLAAVEPGGDVSPLLTQVDAQPLSCITAVAVDADGTIVLTEGSDRRLPSEWGHDLMSANAGGRLLRCRSDGSRPETLRRGLAYPHGVTFSNDHTKVLFTESWRHRVWAGEAAEPHRAEPFLENLPGYPARIHISPQDTYWMAIFAMRTQLIEFVLSQRDYCDEMMETVAPEHWIRPELRPSDDHAHSYLVPLQHGALVALGQRKQSAPPRTYGLVVEVNEAGGIVQSLHDREGGPHPGAVSAAAFGEDLLVASEGGGRLVRANRDRVRATGGTP